MTWDKFASRSWEHLLEQSLSKGPAGEAFRSIRLSRLATTPDRVWRFLDLGIYARPVGRLLGSCSAKEYPVGSPVCELPESGQQQWNLFD